MTSNFKQDQAEQLRKQVEHNNIARSEQVDILELPSRKQKHSRKQENNRKKLKNKQNSKRKKRKDIRFLIIRILLILFFIIVLLVVTYPIWFERISL